MKAIILVAGKGTRLRPHTDDKPKCMVEVAGKSIFEHALESLKRGGLKNISAVTGYKQDRIPASAGTGRGIKKYQNPKFETTNMIYSFFCAEEEFDEDVMLCYGDILFKPEVVRALVESPADFAVIVDKDWRKQWELRMEDPLLDAETMKVNEQGNITELGLKPKTADEIQGQYIGMVKIGKAALPKICEFYHSLDKNALYNGQTFENMYVTDFVQLIIDNVMPAKAVWINGGWFEVDTCNDLKIINEQFKTIFA